MSAKTVVISAAASGIGYAVARSFIGRGAKVYICDRDADAVAQFRSVHPEALAAVANVADPDSVGAFYDQVRADLRRRGDAGLDVLVNNAGIAGPTGPMEALSVESWKETIDVDLNSVFYMTREAIPLLKASAPGSSIINMASNAALFGFPLRSPYTACKWAIIGLTKTLAMELGPYGVRVNALCPGSVEGPRIERVIKADAAARGLTIEEVEREYKSQSSLRVFATNDDIVAMIEFLTSPAGARISGQAIAIDGHTEGLSLKMED
jgi:NAD(P)-dependent dehydrogenase (short-subunit alcohol dehydrogenase family)